MLDKYRNGTNMLGSASVSGSLLVRNGPSSFRGESCTIGPKSGPCQQHVDLAADPAGREASLIGGSAQRITARQETRVDKTSSLNILEVALKRVLWAGVL